MKARRRRGKSAAGNLNANVARLARLLEQANIAEIAAVSQRPFRMLWTNFVSGLARGVGLFLGAGFMGAIALALLSWLVYHVFDQLNWIPVIGQFAHAVSEALKQFLQEHPAKQ